MGTHKSPGNIAVGIFISSESTEILRKTRVYDIFFNNFLRPYLPRTRYFGEKNQQQKTFYFHVAA